jgi:iron complex transport system permease protein
MRAWLLPAVVVGTGALLLVAVAVGPGGVGVVTALGVVLDHLGIGSSHPPIADAIVWDLRLPRALLATTLGAALGAAGAITQGLFRNPMAEPGVLGISMGAAAVTVLGFSLGLDDAGVWVTPVLAALGAASVLLVLFALVGPATGLGTLLLSGIALGALCSALTALMLAFDAERLAAAQWLRVDLDLLHLGPDTAASLGVDLRRTRLVAIVAVAVLVGAATAMAGVIGFLGLIVPHVARLLVGPAHARLMPLSMAIGAFTLLAVDTASRSVTTVTLPPGVITSLMGAPFFLWLLRRHAPGGLS